MSACARDTCVLECESFLGLYKADKEAAAFAFHALICVPKSTVRDVLPPIEHDLVEGLQYVLLCVIESLLNHHDTSR